eukprot:TRINITY_DN3038_c1_g1_i1.p1 TRINITY_DN3038_c1_g1~~TRINITY_DN3038_c1_g1_i1.p1  ORF type:complete len:1042 (+),score=213.26 TRINITY_DN3038_c1_g1_i1:67-3192(+)
MDRKAMLSQLLEWLSSGSDDDGKEKKQNHRKKEGKERKKEKHKKRKKHHRNRSASSEDDRRRVRRSRSRSKSKSKDRPTMEINTNLATMGEYKSGSSLSHSPKDRDVAIEALGTLLNVMRRSATPPQRSPSRVLEYSPMMGADQDPEEELKNFLNLPSRGSGESSALSPKSFKGPVWNRLYTHGVTMNQERASRTKTRELEIEQNQLTNHHTFRPETTMREEANAELRERPERIFHSLYHDHHARDKRRTQLRERVDHNSGKDFTFHPSINPVKPTPANTEWETSFYEKLFNEAKQRREKQSQIEVKTQQSLSYRKVGRSTAESMQEFYRRGEKHIQQGTVEVGWMRRVFNASKGTLGQSAKSCEAGQLLMTLETDLKIKKIIELPTSVWAKMIPRTDFGAIMERLRGIDELERLTWEDFIEMFHEETTEANRDPECTHRPDFARIHHPRSKVRSTSATKLTSAQIRTSVDRLTKRKTSNTPPPPAVRSRHASHTPTRSRKASTTPQRRDTSTQRRTPQRTASEQRRDPSAQRQTSFARKESPPPVPRNNTPAPTKAPKTKKPGPEPVVSFESESEVDDRSPSAAPAPSQPPKPVVQDAKAKPTASPPPAPKPAPVPVSPMKHEDPSKSLATLVANSDSDDEFHSDEDDSAFASPEQETPVREVTNPAPTAHVKDNTSKALEELKKKLARGDGKPKTPPATAPGAKGNGSAVASPSAAAMAKIAAGVASSSSSPAPPSAGRGGALRVKNTTATQQQVPPGAQLALSAAAKAAIAKRAGHTDATQKPASVPQPQQTAAPQQTASAPAPEQAPRVTQPSPGSVVRSQPAPPSRPVVKQAPLVKLPPSSPGMQQGVKVKEASPKRPMPPGQGQRHPQHGVPHNPATPGGASSTGSQILGSAKGMQSPMREPGTPRVAPPVKTAPSPGQYQGTKQPPGFQRVKGQPHPSSPVKQPPVKSAPVKQSPAPGPTPFTRKKIRICKQCGKDKSTIKTCPITGKIHKSAAGADDRSTICGACGNDVSALEMCPVSQQPHQQLGKGPPSLM